MNSENRKMLESLKMETARELGIDLTRKPGDKISARDAGKVGGNMVRRMIREYERSRTPNPGTVK